MSETTLHILIGAALTDSEFREQLLNGGRHSLLADLDLTDVEQKTVMSIEAGSVQEFAAQLYELLPVMGLSSPAPGTSYRN
jgi:hypothetical protein